MNGLEPEVVKLGDGITEKRPARARRAPPEPGVRVPARRRWSRPASRRRIGVLRAVEAPIYEKQTADQLAAVVAKKGKGDLRKLLHAGDTWEVR